MSLRERKIFHALNLSFPSFMTGVIISIALPWSGEDVVQCPAYVLANPRNCQVELPPSAWASWKRCPQTADRFCHTAHSHWWIRPNNLHWKLRSNMREILGRQALPQRWPIAAGWHLSLVFFFIHIHSPIWVGSPLGPDRLSGLNVNALLTHPTILPFLPMPHSH